jgi:hypothetical protein
MHRVGHRIHDALGPPDAEVLEGVAGEQSDERQKDTARCSNPRPTMLDHAASIPSAIETRHTSGSIEP